MCKTLNTPGHKTLRKSTPTKKKQQCGVGLVAKKKRQQGWKEKRRAKPKNGQRKRGPAALFPPPSLSLLPLRFFLRIKQPSLDAAHLSALSPPPLMERTGRRLQKKVSNISPFFFHFSLAVRLPQYFFLRDRFAEQYPFCLFVGLLHEQVELFRHDLRPLFLPDLVVLHRDLFTLRRRLYDRFVLRRLEFRLPRRDFLALRQYPIRDPFFPDTHVVFRFD